LVRLAAPAYKASFNPWGEAGFPMRGNRFSWFRRSATPLESSSLDAIKVEKLNRDRAQPVF